MKRAKPALKEINQQEQVLLEDGQKYNNEPSKVSNYIPTEISKY